jgi:hypothetical protein
MRWKRALSPHREPAAKRDNRGWQTDSGRTKHLLRWLGDKTCSALTLRSVDEYRDHRLLETAQRGTRPSAATLDREVELLEGFLSYASSAGLLTGNPLAEVKLLRKPNVRWRVLGELEYARLFEAREEALKPLLPVALNKGCGSGRFSTSNGVRWTCGRKESSSIAIAQAEASFGGEWANAFPFRMTAAYASVPVTFAW